MKKQSYEIKRKPWDDNDIHKLLSSIKTTNFRDSKTQTNLHSLMLIGMYSGMRIGEICELKKEHIKQNCFYIFEGKTENASRVVPIHSQLLAHIQTMIDKGNKSDAYLIEGLNRRGDDNKRMWNIQKQFGRFKSSAGFGEDKVFHSFRKSFITKLHQAGAEANAIKQIVGHENSDITFGVFTPQGLRFSSCVSL